MCFKLQDYIASGQCISLWKNSREQTHLMLPQWPFHLDISPEVDVLLKGDNPQGIGRI